MNTKLADIFLNSFESEFHIAAITETWLNNTIFDSEIMCSRYQIFRRDRIGKRGGGVLIAVSTLYPAEELLFTNPHHLELVAVVLHIRNFTLFITCSYIPPNSEPELYLMHASCINSVSNKLKPSDFLLVLGDFNIPTASWFTSDDTNFLTPISSND